MILDLIASPTLVITGTWNVPIFTAPWIAHHLFGYPKDAEAPAIQMTAATPDRVRNIIYLRNQGFCADNGRVEWFANQAAADTWGRLEQRAITLLSVLPHTPIGALGVNFRFVERNIGDDLAHSLDTPEGLQGHYNVLHNTAKTTLAVDNDFVCNLQRDLSSDGAMVFDFNYHWADFGQVDNKSDRILGLIEARLNHATQLLQDVYGIGKYEVSYHDFTNEMGANWEVGE